MLSHLSGMPDVEDYEWDKPQYDDGALERYVRSLSNQSLIAAPGAGFRYSNMAYEVLGDLIAKVSGMSFEDYVRRHILEPLGMKSSTLLVKQANSSLLTSPHVMDNSYQTVVSKVFPYNRMHSPSSTVYSNVLSRGVEYRRHRDAEDCWCRMHRLADLVQPVLRDVPGILPLCSQSERRRPADAFRSFLGAGLRRSGP